MRRFDKIALIGMSCEGNGSLGTLIVERQANLDALRVSGFLYRARQRYKGFCRIGRLLRAARREGSRGRRAKS
jgi:hypothetical protein